MEKKFEKKIGMNFVANIFYCRKKSKRNQKITSRVEENIPRDEGLEGLPRETLGHPD